MSENTDLRIGQKYGIWKIVEDTGISTMWGEKIYKAKSDIGDEKIVWYSHIKYGGKGHPIINLKGQASLKQDNITSRVTSPKSHAQKELQYRLPFGISKWSIKYDKCVKCGTTEYPHRARGLCQLCYERKQNIKYAAHIGRDRFSRSIASKKDLSIDKRLSEEILKHQYCVLGKSLADIAREYNCTRQYISKLLKKYDIQPRTKSEARKLAVRRRKLKFEKEVNGKLVTVYHQEWKINKDFFKSWTPEMAYVLGFIYADGNLFEGRNRNPDAKTSATDSRISIAQKDPEILEKIKVLMSCDKKLYKTKNTPKGYLYRLDLNGEEIFEDVVKLGLTPAKSLTVRFPEMPRDCVRHFIRGCWDGDGSIYLEDRKPIASYVSGSWQFIESIVLELSKIGIRSKKWIRSRRGGWWHSDPLTVHQYEGRRGYYIKFGGKNIEKLFHYFYDGVPESQYLKRKYDIFQSSLERAHRRKSARTTSEDALAFYVRFLDPDGIPRLIYFRTEAEMLKFKENLEQDAIL